MLRILFCFLLITSLGSQLPAQHFDDLYQPQVGPAKTWEDSGYVIYATLTHFEVFGSGASPQGIGSLIVNIESTDNSGLMFFGQAVFFYREEDVPPGVMLNNGTDGFATVLIPQNLLFCPDEEAEQGMGQDDPYFPLALVGRFERIGDEWLDIPILMRIQLNDFVVN